MTTIFIDSVTGQELPPEEMQWLQASLELVRTALSPTEFETYKARLLAGCLWEERPKP